MALNGFDTAVSWGDFQHVAARPEGADEDAEIRIHFPHSYDFGRNKNAIIVAAAEVNISLQPNACWAVTGQMTDDLLKHEQGHYNITALGAREFYNKILTLSAPTEKALEEKIKATNAAIQQKINRKNTAYDSQTEHSRNTQSQLQWNKKIAEEKQKPNGSVDNLP